MKDVPGTLIVRPLGSPVMGGVSRCRSTAGRPEPENWKTTRSKAARCPTRTAVTWVTADVVAARRTGRSQVKPAAGVGVAVGIGVGAGVGVGAAVGAGLGVGAAVGIGVAVGAGEGEGVTTPAGVAAGGADGVGDAV